MQTLSSSQALHSRTLWTCLDFSCIHMISHCCLTHLGMPLLHPSTSLILQGPILWSDHSSPNYLSFLSAPEHYRTVLHCYMYLVFLQSNQKPSDPVQKSLSAWHLGLLPPNVPSLFIPIIPVLRARWKFSSWDDAFSPQTISLFSFDFYTLDYSLQ